MFLNSLYFTTKIIVTRVVYMKYDSTKSDLRDTEWNQFCAKTIFCCLGGTGQT